MYSELLKLCGYEPEEVEKERPRVDRAFQISGIGGDDIKRAEERVRFYFDIELEGIRKVLGVWMKEFVDTVLAREEGKKMVYLTFPPVPALGLAVALASKDVYSQSPEIVLQAVMGAIFGKVEPMLEEAEERGMPPGLGHCPLLQTRFGAILRGIIPVPDVALTSCFYCDQASKLDEYLHERYGLPVIYVDGLMDSQWREYPEITPRRVGYLATEITRAMSELKRMLGMEFTEEILDHTLERNSQLWHLLRDITNLQKNDPAPLSNVDIGMVAWMLLSPGRRAVDEGIPAMTTLLEEAKQRVAQGKGKIVKGAPKVFCFFYPLRDPGVMRLIDDAGLCITVSRMYTMSAADRVKPQYTTFAERRVESVLRFGFYHSSASQVYKAVEASREWGVDGAIIYYHFACRPMNIPMLMMKKAMEEELGIPVLMLEGDLYDTRSYTVEALRTRVETFAEMLRVRESTKA